jgi:hypothetical protein
LQIQLSGEVQIPFPEQTDLSVCITPLQKFNSQLSPPNPLLHSQIFEFLHIPLPEQTFKVSLNNFSKQYKSFSHFFPEYPYLHWQLFIE